MNGPAAVDRTAATASAVEGRQRLILRRVWSSLWSHLPMLALSAAATAVPAAAAVALSGAMGTPTLTPLLLAVLAGPLLMALLRVVQGALVEDDTDLRSYLRSLRATALRSAAFSLVPAMCLVSLLAAIEVHARTGNGFMLVSLCLAAVASVLTVSGFMVVIPLAVARPALHGARLWAISWHLLGRWPVRFLAPLTLAGLALWAAVSFSSTLVLLLPAPIALLAGAAYWCCAVELGAEDLVVTEGPAGRRPSST